MLSRRHTDRRRTHTISENGNHLHCKLPICTNTSHFLVCSFKPSVVRNKELLIGVLIGEQAYISDRNREAFQSEAFKLLTVLFFSFKIGNMYAHTILIIFNFFCKLFNNLRSVNGRTISNFLLYTSEVHIIAPPFKDGHSMQN